MLFSDACTWLTACLSFVDSPDKGSTTFDRGSHLIILSAGKTRNCTNSKLLNDSVCKKISYLWSLGVYFKSSPSWRGYLQIFCTGVSRKPAREMSIICCKRRQASKKCLYLPCFISRCNSAHATGCVLQYSEYMEKPSSWEGEKDKGIWANCEENIHYIGSCVCKGTCCRKQEPISLRWGFSGLYFFSRSLRNFLWNL